MRDWELAEGRERAALSTELRQLEAAIGEEVAREEAAAIAGGVGW